MKIIQLRWAGMSLYALAIGLLFTSANAPAAVVFDFIADSTFDCAGVGASVTLEDAAAGKKVILKTVDVIGKDGTCASKGTAHQTFINTRVDALGINSVGQTSGGLEFQDFNPGEAWAISFNVDVTLVEIDLASQDEGAEMTISSSAFKDIVLQDGAFHDIHDLGNTLVPAGTELTLKMTSTASAADTSMRIASLTVAAGKPEKK